MALKKCDEVLNESLAMGVDMRGGGRWRVEGGGGGGRNDDDDEEVGGSGGGRMGLLGLFCCDDCDMSGVGRGLSNCGWDLAEE